MFSLNKSAAQPNHVLETTFGNELTLSNYFYVLRFVPYRLANTRRLEAGACRGPSWWFLPWRLELKWGAPQVYWPTIVLDIEII